MACDENGFELRLAGKYTKTTDEGETLGQTTDSKNVSDGENDAEKCCIRIMEPMMRYLPNIFLPYGLILLKTFRFFSN